MTNKSDELLGYAGQTERTKELSSTEVLQKTIQLIEKMMKDADSYDEYRKIGNNELWFQVYNFLANNARALYKKLKEWVNDWEALRDAWEKYGKDQRLPGAFDLGEEIAKQQKIDTSSTQWKQDETKKVNDLKQQLDN